MGRQALVACKAVASEALVPADDAFRLLAFTPSRPTLLSWFTHAAVGRGDAAEDPNRSPGRWETVAERVTQPEWTFPWYMIDVERATPHWPMYERPINPDSA